jgi:Ras-related C3 botulinum toxin substrate 1
LVGTKVDLREDADTLSKLNQKKQKPVTYEDATAMAAKVGAVTYIEISALKDLNVRKVMEEGLSWLYRSTEKPKKDKCVLM